MNKPVLLFLTVTILAAALCQGPENPYPELFGEKYGALSLDQLAHDNPQLFEFLKAELAENNKEEAMNLHIANEYIQKAGKKSVIIFPISQPSPSFPLKKILIFALRNFRFLVQGQKSTLPKKPTVKILTQP
jgi:hypothetical protein